jgi:hypothetical protein
VDQGKQGILSQSVGFAVLDERSLHLDNAIQHKGKHAAVCILMEHISATRQPSFETSFKLQSSSSVALQPLSGLGLC